MKKIWVEHYRPSKFSELVFTDAQVIERYLKQDKVPSFVFYSTPGTGKTSLAKIIAQDFDTMLINASDERGIDVIRDKVKVFASTLSSNDKQKCVIFGEADKLTKDAQDSLKEYIEDYSEYAFFIFTTNNLEKLIDAIKSRCIQINFGLPPKDRVLERLNTICKSENFQIDKAKLTHLIDLRYPDIRSMINDLQALSLGKEFTSESDFRQLSKYIKEHNILGIYNLIYDSAFDKDGFVKYYFKRVMESTEKLGPKKTERIALLLADIEKSWQIGVHKDIVFVANIVAIANELS